MDDYAANRLEIVNGHATGRLLPAMAERHSKAKWIELLNAASSALRFLLFRQHFDFKLTLNRRDTGGGQPDFR